MPLARYGMALEREENITEQRSTRCEKLCSLALDSRCSDRQWQLCRTESPQLLETPSKGMARLRGHIWIHTHQEKIILVVIQ